MVLFASLFSMSAFAESSKSIIDSPVESKKSLNSARLLKKNDIFKIVETNIKGYLKSDFQTEGKNIVASDDFINLYDLENNLFAYMVPLLENGKEIGYITVGAIEDGYATYDIFINNNIVNEIKSTIKGKTNLSSKKAQLVFMPPLNYIIKVTDGQTEKYIDISKPNKEVEITEQIKKNKHKLQEEYTNIRKEDNKNHIQKLINNDSVVSANVTQEDVALTFERNYGMFVPVEYQTGTYSYGGNQNWWPDGGAKESRGCGPVAAANITNYLATIKDTQKYGKLYTGNTKSYTDFLAHMDNLYNYIDPGMFGETSVSDFAADVERFATDKGVSLSRVTSSASFTLDNTTNYIKAGLSINSPVGTLNTKKWSDYEYEWHWMTISKYYRDINDNRWIAVSTWGERRSIDYRVHFDAMKNGWVQGGLMYFK